MQLLYEKSSIPETGSPAEFAMMLYLAERWRMAHGVITQIAHLLGADQKKASDAIAQMMHLISEKDVEQEMQNRQKQLEEWTKMPALNVQKLPMMADFEKEQAESVRREKIQDIMKAARKKGLY